MRRLAKPEVRDYSLVADALAIEDAFDIPIFKNGERLDL